MGGSVAQARDRRRRFPQIFIAASRRAHRPLVDSGPLRREEQQMSRFSMALVAAAASALVAIAVVALPAFGGDSGSPTSPAKPAPDFSALVACLSAHGLTGAPATPEQFKPWLGAKEASDPQATKAAEKACDDQAPNGLDVHQGPDIQALGACLRSHGLDAPTAPDALKRWLADQSGGPAFAACKMQLDPGKPGAGDKKLPDCGTPAQPPADKAPADKPTTDQAAPSGT